MSARSVVLGEERCYFMIFTVSLQPHGLLCQQVTATLWLICTKCGRRTWLGQQGRRSSCATFLLSDSLTDAQPGFSPTAPSLGPERSVMVTPMFTS